MAKGRRVKTHEPGVLDKVTRHVVYIEGNHPADNSLIYRCENCRHTSFNLSAPCPKARKEEAS